MDDVFSWLSAVGVVSLVITLWLHWLIVRKTK